MQSSSSPGIDEPDALVVWMPARPRTKAGAKLPVVKLSLPKPRQALRLLKQTFDAWMEDNALRLSAALAYYSIFSIAPLLVIAIGIAGLVLGEEAVRGQLGVQLRSYIGPQAAEGVETLVKSASQPSHGWIGTIVGAFTLFIGASGVFGQLKDALNTIWEVKPIAGSGVWMFIRDRLLSFGMVLVIGFLLLTSLLLTTAMAGLSGYVEHLIGLPPVVGGIIGFLAAFLVVTLLFALIFKVLPDAKVEWRNVWIGAAVTALLFEIGKFGLSFYLGRESTVSGFGAAGSVVLLLLWVYYASCILLFGAEFTQVYARETGHRILPAENAIPVTAEARAQQGMLPAAAKKGETPRLPKPVLIPVRPLPDGPSPVGALLGVTGAALLVGLLARRSGPTQSPGDQIRSGLSDLGEEAGDRVAKWLERRRG